MKSRKDNLPYVVKFNGDQGAIVCKYCWSIIHYGFEAVNHIVEDHLNYTCKIQNNCKYGYVLPDRCRYNSRTGCDCGAYPPLTYSKE